MRHLVVLSLCELESCALVHVSALSRNGSSSGIAEAMLINGWHDMQHRHSSYDSETSTWTLTLLAKKSDGESASNIAG